MRNSTRSGMMTTLSRIMAMLVFFSGGWACKKEGGGKEDLLSSLSSNVLNANEKGTLCQSQPLPFLVYMGATTDYTAADRTELINKTHSCPATFVKFKERSFLIASSVCLFESLAHHFRDKRISADSHSYFMGSQKDLYALVSGWKVSQWGKQNQVISGFMTLKPSFDRATADSPIRLIWKDGKKNLVLEESPRVQKKKFVHFHPRHLGLSSTSFYFGSSMDFAAIEVPDSFATIAKTSAFELAARSDRAELKSRDLCFLNGHVQRPQIRPADYSGSALAARMHEIVFCQDPDIWKLGGQTKPGKFASYWSQRVHPDTWLLPSTLQLGIESLEARIDAPQGPPPLEFQGNSTLADLFPKDPRPCLGFDRGRPIWGLNEGTLELVGLCGSVRPPLLRIPDGLEETAGRCKKPGAVAQTVPDSEEGPGVDAGTDRQVRASVSKGSIYVMSDINEHLKWLGDLVTMEPRLTQTWICSTTASTSRAGIIRTFTVEREQSVWRYSQLVQYQMVGLGHPLRRHIANFGHLLYEGSFAVEGGDLVALGSKGVTTGQSHSETAVQSVSAVPKHMSFRLVGAVAKLSENAQLPGDEFDLKMVPLAEEQQKVSEDARTFVCRSWF